MIYPVSVYTPQGKLKKIVSTKTLLKIHWAELDLDAPAIKRLQTRCVADKPAGPRKSRKVVPMVCAIWPILCAYIPCSAPTVKRSVVGKFCSPECKRNEENRRRRAKLTNK
jgi:hypothetical protein